MQRSKSRRRALALALGIAALLILSAVTISTASQSGVLQTATATPDASQPAPDDASEESGGRLHLHQP